MGQNMIVKRGFFGHHKTLRLIDVLKDRNAPLYVLKLWAHCEDARTWEFFWQDDRMKWICGFPGEEHVLRAALITSGFIIQNPNEPMGFYVHQWEQHNAKLTTSWNNGAKGGRPRKPNQNPSITQKNPPNTNTKEVQSKYKSGFPLGFQAQPELTEEQRQANRAKLALALKEAREKMRADTATQPEEEDHGAK
jgi:hypothetical protein